MAAGNEQIQKAILQLEVDYQKALTDLQKVTGEYKKVSAEAQKQNKQLVELQKQEQKLSQARAKSNNPSNIAKYDKQLFIVRKEMEALNASIKKTTDTEKVMAKETVTLGKQLNAAFSTTAINGFNNEVIKAEKEVDSFGNTASDATEETEKGTEKVLNKFQLLRKEMKEAKGALIEAIGEGNQAKINAAAARVGKLKDELEDAADAAKIFASESKFEQIGTALGGVSSKLLSLDFKGANEQSKLLVATTKSLTFKEAGQGIADLGQTLFNLGKALLTNPLFLLGAVIIGIITNFDKLKASGGFLGTVFRGIAKIITELGNAVDDFTDLIGATTVALDKLQEKQQQFLAKSLENAKRVGELQTAIRAAQGRNTQKLEDENLKRQAQLAEAEIKLIRARNERKGLVAKQFSDDDKKRIQELTDLIIDAEQERAVKTIEAFEKGRNKIREITRKEIPDELDKIKNFNVEFKLKPLSKEQVEANFKVQRDAVARQRQEEINAAALEFEGNNQKGAILAAIERKFSLQRKLLKLQEQKAILDSEKELADQQLAIRQEFFDKASANQKAELDQSRELQDAQVSQLEATTEEGLLKESETTRLRLDIQKQYFDDLIKLTEVNNASQAQLNQDAIANAEKDIAARKAAGLDTTNQEIALNKLVLDSNIQIANSERELSSLKTQAKTTELVTTRAINEKILEENLKVLDAEKEHASAQLTLSHARQSTILASEVEFEKQRLEILKKAGKTNTLEYKAQQDRINQLNQDAIKQRRLENIGYFEEIAKAAIDATNKILDAKLKEIEGQTELQQQRVNEAKDIADKGNAELLEAEQDRLDKLNKEKERFVRQQQSLAAVELVANTAIAVSKAAAEGGAAAGITIAAALLALVAGLASARSIASQAAFYKGGEYEGQGFTGEGNPAQESKAVGAKPYTYHKREFIFNHQATDKYRDIFQRIHGKQIDLREWEKKVMAFDSMKSMNINNPIVLKQFQPQNNDRVDRLESLMSGMIEAIEGQERVSVNISNKGFYASVMKYKQRQDLINRLSK